MATKLKPETAAAYLALPVDTRRALLRCDEATKAFAVLDRTGLSEDVKCEIAGTFPLVPNRAATAAHREEG